MKDFLSLLVVLLPFLLSAFENSHSKPSPSKEAKPPVVIYYFDQRIQRTTVIYQSWQTQAVTPSTTAPQRNYATTNWPQRTYQAPKSYQQTTVYPVRLYYSGVF